MGIENQYDKGIYSIFRAIQILYDTLPACFTGEAVMTVIY